MSEIAIKVENLSFAYTDQDDNKKWALKNVNLEIEKGSFVAILGHNGCGKSTLAKLLNLLLIPASGDISIFGEKIDLDTITEQKLYEIRQKIGLVFQNPDNQLVATIVEEDVAFGPENIGIEPSEIRRRVDAALELVGMKDYKKHSPHQLSGGQKQRVAIAGVLALSPDIIIFDESTAMLDPKGREEVLETIFKLNKEENKTIILITHYMEEAIFADRVVVMNDKSIYLDGTPKEVFSQVEKLRNVKLEVPQITELFYELGFENLPINIEEGIDLIDAKVKRGI